MSVYAENRLKMICTKPVEKEEMDETVSKEGRDTGSYL